MAYWRTKAAIPLKRVKIEEELLWRAIGTHQRSFGWYHSQHLGNSHFVTSSKTPMDKKLSYCWETVRRESMPRIAEMDMEMTT